MIQRTPLVLVAIALASWCSTEAYGCTSCTRDGWRGQYSSSIANCMITRPPPDCEIGYVSRLAFLDVMHPGVFLKDSERQTTLSGVLDGSSALLSGRDGSFQDASYTKNSESHESVLTARNQPFTSGILLSSESGQVGVKAVMNSSPAWQAGIRPGMKVLAVNGVPVNSASLHTAESKLDGYWLTQLVLRLSDGAGERFASFSTIGLSSIYRRKTEKTKPQQSELLASVATK